MTIGRHSTGSAAPTPRSGWPQVAVAGAGVAGLTAAYLLQRRYDVTLHEAQDRLGGHAHTHDIASAGVRTRFPNVGCARSGLSARTGRSLLVAAVNLNSSPPGSWAPGWWQGIRPDIRSYIDTARKHGKNAMDVLHDLMPGRPRRPPAPAFSR